jgi:uncharacterized protein (UPF0333 family)
VKSALGGPAQMLANFNQTVSTTASGIGGVVGTALAASGFAGVYAAWNPTTQTQGAYIKNANSLLPNVDPSPPVGWVSTGLISVWPLNASTQFVSGQQKNRRFAGTAVQVISTSTLQASFTSLNVASAVPANAIECDAAVLLSSSVATTISYGFAADANGSGGASSSGGNVTQLGNTVSNITIGTSQTIYYKSAQTSGTTSFTVSIGTWEF